MTRPLYALVLYKITSPKTTRISTRINKAPSAFFSTGFLNGKNPHLSQHSGCSLRNGSFHKPEFRQKKQIRSEFKTVLSSVLFLFPKLVRFRIPPPTVLHLFLLYLCHSRNGLPQRDTAVIGRKQAVSEHTESLFFKFFFTQFQQKLILEYSAAEGTGA